MVSPALRGWNSWKPVRFPALEVWVQVSPALRGWNSWKLLIRCAKRLSALVSPALRGWNSWKQRRLSMDAHDLPSHQPFAVGIVGNLDDEAVRQSDSRLTSPSRLE